MLIVMVWIIYFGFSKLFLVQDTLSAQEEIEIKNKIEEEFSYCSNPLNKGDFKTFELKHSSFNSFCILGKGFSTPSGFSNSEFDFELEALKSTIEDKSLGIFLKTNYDKSSNSILEFDIVTATEIGKENLDLKCFFDENNDGKVEIEIKC